MKASFAVTSLFLAGAAQAQVVGAYWFSPRISWRQSLTFSPGKPQGFAAGVTGGGSLTPVIPKDIKELATFLSDSTPRVILLDKIYDFTSSEGTKSVTACSAWTCSPNPQLALDLVAGWCDSYPKTTATYNVAATKLVYSTLHLIYQRTFIHHQQSSHCRIKQVYHWQRSRWRYQRQGSQYGQGQERHHPEHQDHRFKPAICVGR